jgi:hypothetical protein
LSAVDFNRQELADQAASLAVQGVYIGTSSWKYPGWCGMLYDRARYEYRGKFAETRFKQATGGLFFGLVLSLSQSARNPPLLPDAR